MVLRDFNPIDSYVFDKRLRYTVHIDIDTYTAIACIGIDTVPVTAVIHT